MDLKALRQQLRQARRALDKHQHAQRSTAICQQLMNHRAFRAAQHIACYLPNDGEADLGLLIEQADAMGKTVYLPVLSSIHHNRLHFLPYAPGDRLMANEFGIPEPLLTSRRVTAITRLDLVLTPLVGFDAQGNRLGMGGGFYDRTFAFMTRTRYQKPRLWAIAVESQCYELEANPWDVPIHGVATEKAVHRYG